MEYIIAKERAIKYIGISKKTKKEVITKLKGLNVEEDIILKIIDELEEYGYINDIAFSNSYILECSRMKKYSIFEIKQKLLQKGIKKSIISESITSLEESDYEKEVMQKLINAKSKNMDEMKLKKYLYSRGFKGVNESECF